MPSAFYLPVRHKRFNWGYASEPESNLNNRRLLCPRGRLLGGSSSINGMVYVRGNAQDYDAWQQAGALGWDYQSVLPYFKKAQKFAGLEQSDDYRGHAGPLAVTNGALSNPLNQTFLAASKEAGYPQSDDLNGAQQEGFGALPMTVEHGVRASAARAYLKPASARSNLRIQSHASVQKIVFTGKRATGAVATIGGRPTRIEADHVILCAGAINTPQLLMLSGIGPADHLQEHDIPCLHDAPGVGQNLMDHLEIYVQNACTQPVSLYKDLSLVGRAKIGLRWFIDQSGLGATNHFEVGGFVKSQSSQPYPDIQFHFLPAAMQYDGSAKAETNGFQAHVGPMLSESRGSIRLNSNDPQDHPRIKFNYMSDASDWTVFRSAIRKAREIFAQPAFDDYRGPELRPGSAAQSDQQLDDFIKQYAESAYHPCGTCRMGTDDLAVVSPEGGVVGLENLYVVDASIFPTIPNANINGPTIMVAEKMADALQRHL